MNKYLVGGVVRDYYLYAKDTTKLHSSDVDWVVVGETEQSMLQKGYKRVGKDFPVFLHPTTGEHHALARRERKISAGHRGFVCEFDKSVTLEEDLSRRDLTINAIATREGIITDPFGGLEDIRLKRLRVVSSDSFADDPLRVLRLARFAAILPDFSITNTTMQLARTAAAEISTISQERIFSETYKALLSAKPSRFFNILDECGALETVFPEIYALKNAVENKDYHPEGNTYNHTMLVIDAAASNKYIDEDRKIKIMFACLYHDIGKGVTFKGHEKIGVDIAYNALKRLTCPSYIIDFTKVCIRNHMRAHRYSELRASTVLQILLEVDGLKPGLYGIGANQKLFDFLEVVDCDKTGRLVACEPKFMTKRTCFFYYALKAAVSVQGKDMIAMGIAPGGNPGQVGPRLREERIKAIKKVQGEIKNASNSD